MFAKVVALALAGASAAPPKPTARTVAVLTVEPQAAATRAIADELAAAGYAVQLRNDAPSVDVDTMPGVEPCASAWACIGLRPEERGWTAQVFTRGEPQLHRRLVFTEEGEDAPQTLGLRLAEALHAAESATPTPSPSSSAPPPPAPAPPRLVLGAEATVFGSPGGTTPTVGPSIAFSYFPHRVVGFDVALHATALEAARSEPEGLALVGMSWAWLGVAARRVWPRVAIGGRVGGGPLVAWARGRARAPLSDRTQVVGGAVVGGAPFIDVRLHRGLYLRTSGWVLFTIPTLDLSVTGRRVATVGLPLFGLSLGLAWGRA